MDKKKDYNISVYTLAGAKGLDISTTPSVVLAAVDGINRAYEIADKFLLIINNIKKHGNSHPAITLQTIILEHVKVVTENHDASAVFTNEWRFLEEPDLENFIKLRNKYERFIEKTIKDGVEQGIFKTNNTKLLK